MIRAYLNNKYFQLSTQYPCISYTLTEDGICVTSGRTEISEVLHLRLKRSIQDVEIHSK